MTVLAGALVASSCGSRPDAVSPPATVRVTLGPRPSTASTGPSTAPAAGSPLGPDDTSGSGPAPAADGSPPGPQGCADFALRFAALVGQPAAVLDAADAADAPGGLDAFRADLAELRRSLPAAVAADASVVLDAYAAVADDLAGTAPGPAGTRGRRAALRHLRTAEVTEAQRHVDDFVARCGR